MVSAGIGVAKHKHSPIVGLESEVQADVFSAFNTMNGLNCLLRRIRGCTTPQGKIKGGLVAAEHYRYRSLRVLLDSGLSTFYSEESHSSRMCSHLRRPRKRNMSYRLVYSKTGIFEEFGTGHSDQRGEIQMNFLSLEEMYQKWQELLVIGKTIERESYNCLLYTSRCV